MDRYVILRIFYGSYINNTDERKSSGCKKSINICVINWNKIIDVIKKINETIRGVGWMNGATNDDNY